MNFIAPFMLWGVAAAGIPIAIHFFFRSRYRTVPWAAMKFLLTSIEQTSRRLKFQEYLLLLIRISLPVFLALALARLLNLSGVGFAWFFIAVVLTVVTLTWALAPFWKVSSSSANNLVIYLGSQTALLLLSGVVWLLFWMLFTEAPASAAGSASAVDAVFLFDTSFSMGVHEGRETRIDFAKQAADKILGQLPPYSTVQIITCADRAELLGPRESGNHEQARELIKKLELTDLATDLAPGVKEAKEAFQRGTNTNKELYLFSDMQKLGWEQKAGELNQSLNEMSKTTAIHLVRCGTQSPRNVAIVGVAPQSGIPRPGERVGFAVLVKNTGASEVQNLRVALSADGRSKEQEEQSIASLGPGETRAVTLSARLEQAGRRVLTARVRQDDLEADNNYYQVVQVREQVRVLVIDGGLSEKEPDRSSSFFLMHALVPVKSELRARYHVRATLVSPRRVGPEELERNDLCILVNTALERDLKRNAEAPSSEFLDGLGDFVKKGGGLIVFGGDNVAADAYNRILGKRLGLLPSKLNGFATFPASKPAVIDRNSIESAAFIRFREDEDYKDLSNSDIYKTLDIEGPQAPDKDAKDEATKSAVARVLMRYGNGKPAVVARQVGAGEVLLFGTSAGPEFKPKTSEPTWNYLFIWPGYVPLIEGSMNYLLARQAQNKNFTAGESLAWQPPQDFSEAPFVLLGPPERPGEPSRRIPLGKPKDVQGRPLVTAPGLTRAGVYTLTTSEGADPALSDMPEPERPGGDAAQRRQPPVVPFAVVPDLHESASLETFTDAQLDEHLGFRPIHLTAGANMNLTTFAERSSREWTMWLLVLVMLLAVGEMALAWFCGRSW